MWSSPDCGEQLAERAALLLVDRNETDLPRALFAVAEQRVAGHDEHLRELLVDRGLAPGAVGRRAEADAGGEHVVRDHLLEVRQGLLRVVAVVVGLDLDGAGLAVAELDAALGVLDAEVGQRPVDRAVAGAGGRAGERAGDAERDARVGDAGAGLGRSFTGVAAAVGVSPAGASGDEHGDDADARDDRGDPQSLVQCAHVFCLFSSDCVGGLELCSRLRRRHRRGRETSPPGSTKRITSRMTPCSTAVRLESIAFVSCGAST